MVETVGRQGVLRVVSGGDLDKHDREQDAAYAAAQQPLSDQTLDNLAGFIRAQFEQFKSHRDDAAAGWSERLLEAMRAFKGRYSASKLAEIRKFGGSEVYARIVAMKCRGASSLLRDVYLQPERPWGLDPPADPDIPPEIVASITQLVDAEVASMSSLGQPPDVNAIRDRVNQLMEGARVAAKKKAKQQAQVAEDRIEELLQEGGFYKALAEFLVDLPLFPFACIKGPVVRIVPRVTWNGGRPSVEQRPRMFWNRISPFDLWWTPGASDIEDASVIERTRLTRAELNDLLDLPGYNHDNVRAVLEAYGSGGLVDDWDTTDAERAIDENRENPQWNRSGMITCLEFHGNVQGKLLRDYGMDAKLIPDELRDYMVQAWVIGRYVIKVQLSPSPRKRHPYFVSSFEKVPGTPVGNGLPDIIADVADVCNSVLRALVNNLSISSGPQVVVNDDRLAPGENGDDLFPWKRWHVTSDPLANNSQMAISFFQPNSIANELLSVYKEFNDIADNLSAIPRYLSGQGATGGAGRTASGLAMLMGNASKILQTVAANIDRDLFEPMLSSLYDMVMLTDTTGLLTGEETIRVMGVAVAIQRETQRSRQLEFLQITANPVDAKIMGAEGRSVVLRSVAKTIGIEGEEIVPSEERLREIQQQDQMMQAAQAAQAQDPEAAGRAAQGGQQGSAQSGDMGPRTNLTGGP